jgi:integrase
VAVYQRTSGGAYHVEVEWRGYPRLRLATGTRHKARAVAMERTLHALKSAGRRDILGLLAAQRLELADVHEEYLRRPADLEHRIAHLESPPLGILVDEWLRWLPSPAALSPRTRRPFAPRTVERYAQSWARFFALLPRGREARLQELTKGFISDYRARRREAGTAPATVNRDLCALGAFYTWLAGERGITVTRPAVAKEREPSGRERWLSADEIQALHRASPAAWWPFYALLVYTGLRWGEAAGLTWGDVRLAERRITVTDRSRRLKTSSSVRDVPIPEPLAHLLAEHRTRYPGGPADPVFPAPFDAYPRARRLFQAVALEAGLHDGGRNPAGVPRPNVTIHDLRHTFGVHCAQAGVPIVRLQKLLGHASPHMTLRYMKHAPESYFAEDAARVAASLTGERNREAEAQAALAREGIRRV